MGCGCAKAGGVSDPKAKQAAQSKKDAEYARRLQAEEDAAARGGGGGGRGDSEQATPTAVPAVAFKGQGQVLGGGASSGASTENLSAEERRQRVLEAAEKRNNSMKGISDTKVAQMKEKQAKDEYLGKIAEYYNRKKLEMPMGLNAATAEQLKKHWEGLRKGESHTDMVLNA